jgi:uncharacterized protein (TIGR02246 family)
MEKELTEEVLTVEEELQKDKDAFVKAWNEHDIKSLVNAFAEDAVRIGFYGEKSRGKKEIEEAYNKINENLPDSKLHFNKGEVRRLGDNYAVWQGGFEIEKTDGSKPLKGYVVQISKKVKDRWLIVEAHARLSDQEK